MKFLVYLNILCFLSSCTNDNLSSPKDTKKTPKLIAKENVKESVIEQVPMYSNAEVYHFMNTAILGNIDGKINFSSRISPISISSIFINPDEKEQILSQKELDYFKSMVDSNEYIWDCTKLKNINCLEDKIVDSIFNADKDSFGRKIGGMEHYDPWNALALYYGEKGINSYSIPLFNKDTSIAIIQCNSSAHFTLGSGYVRVYTKQKKQWKFVKDFLVWMS